MYRPTFTNLLKQHLEHQDRNQTWLAKQIHVRPQTVSRWLASDLRPGSAELVNKIADALGLNNEERKQLLIAAGYVVDPPSAVPEPNAGIWQSQFVRNEEDFIPAEGLSSEQLIVALENAQKRNLKLEFGYRLVPVTLGLLLIIVVTLLASPVARETTLRAVQGIMQQIRDVLPDVTPTPVPSPTETTQPLAEVATATLPLATSQTLAATPTITVVQQTATSVPSLTPTLVAPGTSSSGAVAPAVSAPPASADGCDVMVDSPGGTWPLVIAFREVPDGTSSRERTYELGDKVKFLRESPDGRWYLIEDLNNQELGWASPEYFTDCLTTVQ